MQYQRSIILAQLEPYPDFSIADCVSAQVNLYDYENYLLKIDFINFVLRFEREQMSIIEFGSAISFSEKISIIKQKLLSYVREQNNNATAPPIPRTVSGGNGGNPATATAG